MITPPPRGLGISTVDFKLSGRPDLFIIENTFHAKGGPARHLHTDQDEWFYVVAGEFIIEVGEVQSHLKVGDSLLAPRNIPHVFACVGDGQGKLLIAFTPAGHMEAFFQKVTQTNAMPIQDPVLWRTHGMELLGAPLSVE